ncbi:alanine-zipper protein, partial [Veillonella magna]|uniref:alanine-zipper protein n=1 Tax=Veillonella magna TaxID=464322 RepID=UPI0026DC462D
MVQAAGVTDTTEKGGVAVNLSSDTATGATASGTGAVAEGEGATASGTNAVAIGNTAKSDSTGAIAIGNNAKTITVKETVKKDDGTEKERIYPASHSIAIGTDSQAIQSKSIAIGYGALAQKGDNVAIGNTAKAKGNRAIATGAYTEAGEYSLATGYNALANGQHSIAIGDRAKASKLVGKEETPIDYAIVMGYKARANTGALSLGREADAGEFAIAQGWKAKAPGYGSIANGVSTNSAGQWAISIGGFAQNTEKSPYAVSIGTSAYVGDLSDEIKKFTIKETPTRLISDMEEVPTEYVNVDGSPASGDESSISKEEYDNPQEGSLAIGWNTGASGFEATAIGQGTRAYGKRSVAIGLSSRAIEESSVAIGQQTVAAAIDALAVGRFANAFAYGSIAMGARTEIGSKAANAVALGMWARTDQTNSVALGSYSSTEGIDVAGGKAKYSNEAVKGNVGVISVGTEAYSLEFGKDNLNIPDIKRRIVNVAGGINDNDAVNVKQLTAVAESPVYIYSGGSVSDSVYGNGTAVVPEANKNYTISNLRFAFTDGLTAGTVTDSDGNKLVKVGISDDYMNKINQAVADAKTAQGKAEEAQGKAEEAQGKAEDAQSKAEAAQGKAEEAQGKAEDAQGKAEAAQGKAEEAQGKAEDAQGKAEAAQGKAEEAQGKAEDAQGKAEAAQGKAEEAQGKAEDAQSKAEA